MGVGAGVGDAGDGEAAGVGGAVVAGTGVVAGGEPVVPVAGAAVVGKTVFEPAVAMEPSAVTVPGTQAVTTVWSAVGTLQAVKATSEPMVVAVPAKPAAETQQPSGTVVVNIVVSVLVPVVVPAVPAAQAVETKLPRAATEQAMTVLAPPAVVALPTEPATLLYEPSGTALNAMGAVSVP
jgi:hypothetical protein